jgi:hypothetical protein
MLLREGEAQILEAQQQRLADVKVSAGRVA